MCALGKAGRNFADAEHQREKNGLLKHSPSYRDKTFTAPTMKDTQATTSTLHIRSL